MEVLTAIFISAVPLLRISFFMLGAKVYPADIKVKFKDTYALLGQNVTLECFALGK